MASRQSRSPSTPSEGEIVESGSETKATTSQTPLHDIKVDRPTRASPPSVSGSSAAARRSRSRSRSRTRSRSPYRRDVRDSKRRRDDDYNYDDRRYREPRRRSGYDDRSYDRRGSRGRRSYHDYDRENGYGGALEYSDRYDRRRDKRQRTRSRSPFRHDRKPRHQMRDESGFRREERGSADGRMRRSSTEQLVSERGDTVARPPRHDAETRDNQVQQASPDAAHAAERYVVGLFLGNH